LRTTSPMDAKWWQYLTWTFGSGDLAFRRTTRATFLEGLETSHAVVLDKQSTISLSIRGKDSHLRFLIVSRRYNSLWLKEHFWQLVASQLVTAHTIVVSSTEVNNVSTNQRPGGHLGFWIDPKDTIYFSRTQRGKLLVNLVNTWWMDLWLF
jgi:hypothetical protein